MLCLNQLWSNRITVNDAPRILPGRDVKNPHSIYILEAAFMIPLKVKWEMSGFDNSTTKQHEFSICAHVVLTSYSIWDPSGSYLEKK